MTQHTGEGRPALNGTASGNLDANHPNSTASSVVPAGIAERASRPGYALKVFSERVDGVVVVQLFTTLSAAQGKVRRVHERGLWAAMFLVRIENVTDARLHSRGGFTLIGEDQ